MFIVDETGFYIQIPFTVVPSENLSSERLAHTSEILDTIQDRTINIGELAMDAMGF